MVKSPKCLLIGSTETYSGKSTVIIGLAHQLQTKGFKVAYGKPLGTCSKTTLGDQRSTVDVDVAFVAEVLGLTSDQVYPTVLHLDEPTIRQRLQRQDMTDYPQAIARACVDQGGDFLLLEGPSTLAEGHVFGLALPQLAEMTNAGVLLVTHFQSLLLVDALLTARQLLGDRLLGVVINSIPASAMALVRDEVCPLLESQGVPVLGLLPQNTLLQCVTVAELVERLQAQVLCCGDRLDLLVESLKIGAMNVNAALEYLRQSHNAAVVTGGDRTDIQLAALETSTQCLILTGHPIHDSRILMRAQDLEIPILAVDLDTLSTVEIIMDTFARSRLRSVIQVEALHHLMADHFKLSQLLSQMDPLPVNC